ncbi:hypothetical protein ACS0TY_032875 [Phlomoides rotata]
MEAQIVNLRGYIHGAVDPVQTRKIYLFTKLPVSFSTEIRSSTGVSLKSYCSFRSNPLIIMRNFQCRNNVEKADCRGVSDIEEDKPKTIIRRKNLAVFVSGGGSNFRSIYEATLGGSVLGDVVVLVTNKHDCGGAEYAREKGIPVLVFPKRKENQNVFSAQDLVIALRSDLYFTISIIYSFGGKGYYGLKVHKAVIALGARYSGPSIHYVDEHYDTGRILAQRVVPVLAKDTAEDLAARVLHEEHKLYVEVCKALCEERITWREDGVPLIQSKENPSDYQ